MVSASGILILCNLIILCTVVFSRLLHTPRGRLLMTSESAGHIYRDSGRGSNVSCLGTIQIAVSLLRMFYQAVVSYL
jgi:hypothetical protein